MEKCIGVEIGGTKQQIAVGYDDGTLLWKESVHLQLKQGASDIRSWLELKIKDTLKKTGDTCIKKICVGFGGPVDSSLGVALCSLQISGWDNFPLAEWFRNTFGIEAIILNDTVAGGLAELYRGRGQGSPRFFYTNIGTGIGGCLYINKRCYDGSGYGSSYLGNTWVPDWTGKNPGSVTRLELLCSGAGIESRLNTPGYIPDGSILKKDKNITITCLDFEHGVTVQDPFCLQELDRICRSFSIGLTNVLTLTGADTVVIGGGVAKIGNVLFDLIRMYTKEFEFIANAGRYCILQSSLLDDAVLVGALLAPKYFDVVP